MSLSQNSNQTTSSCSTCTSSNAPTTSAAIEGTVGEDEPKIYQEFSLNIQQKVAPDRVPTNGSIEIIENCNFKCIHCYQGMNKSKRTLSGDEWCAILDQLADAGTLWLLITGGEPLLHPDFEQIYVHAVKKGFLLNLFTNAFMIKDHHLDLFKKYPPFSIEVTLYGGSEHSYQIVTQTRNSYAKVVENCQKILAAGLPLKLKTVAIKQLLHEVADIKNFAEEEMGVQFKFDTKVDPTIYGDPLDHVRPTAEESVALEEELLGREPVALDLIHYKAKSERTIEYAGTQEALYNCGAGKNSYYIDYKGQVHICSIGRSEEKKFNLAQNSFKDIWYKEFPGVIFQDARDKNEVCRTCEYRTMCDACPATAKLATGSKYGRPMYVCQQTMMRKEKFLDSLTAK